jgi:hypothetical protein
MAFKFFKKKEGEFPTEEKASVLDDSELPPLPALPQLPEMEQQNNDISAFKEGFHSPQELKPPMINKPSFSNQNQLLPPPPQSEIPPFKPPEPLPMQKPQPMAPELPKSEFGEVPKIKKMPHIYIRIDKYKEVMNTIKNLGEQIRATKSDLEDIHEISENEREKIKEAAEVLLEIEKLLNYLDKTFTTTEE